MLRIALLVETIRTGQPATWIALVLALAGSFVFEWVLRRRRRTSNTPGERP